jgi:hypothetical protein
MFHAPFGESEYFSDTDIHSLTEHDEELGPTPPYSLPAPDDELCLFPEQVGAESCHSQDGYLMLNSQSINNDIKMEKRCEEKRF